MKNVPNHQPVHISTSNFNLFLGAPRTRSPGHRESQRTLRGLKANPPLRIGPEKYQDGTGVGTGWYRGFEIDDGWDFCWFLRRETLVDSGSLREAAQLDWIAVNF